MEFTSKTKFQLGLTALLGAVTLAAVGVAAQDTGAQPGAANPNATPGTAASPAPVQTTQRQVFIANLSPAPGSAASAIARIVVDSGRIGVSVQGSGLDPNTLHAMHIHSGNLCADVTADTNGDGIVDDVEGEAISGPPVVPLSLSGDVRVQPPAAGAQDTYPIAADDGALNYINGGSVASFGTLPALFVPGQQAGTAASPSPSASPLESATPLVSPSALASPEATPSESATPLVSPSASASPTETPIVLPSASPSVSPVVVPIATLPTDQLGLNGRVIEIHGVSADTTLPETARSSVSSQTPQQSLPVACGILTQVSE